MYIFVLMQTMLRLTGDWHVLTEPAPLKHLMKLSGDKVANFLDAVAVDILDPSQLHSWMLIRHMSII